MKTIITGHSQADIFLFADSAVGREAQPLFVPDGEWVGCLRLAVRVHLLGKTIAPAFVPRHIDSWSVVLVMRPAGEVALPGWLSIMDSAVTAGRWQPLGGGPLAYEAQLPDGQTVSVGPFSMDEVCQAVSQASQLATLKTGDIIIPPFAGQPEFPLRPGTRLEVPGFLSVKIK
ncbi:MAG: hypothetical protein K2N16_02720 [Muribaculaceae bacterium]|nr:hypothetical protein [Muribaculaceae bacterium]